jgi:hypothetical protein
MAYKAWTPVVVAGTDMDGKPPIPMNGNVIDDNSDVIVSSHAELAEYSESIAKLPEGIRGYIDQNDVTWKYGPLQTRDGERGQYVAEFHNDIEHQVYWVPC